MKDRKNINYKKDLCLNTQTLTWTTKAIEIVFLSLLNGNVLNFKLLLTYDYTIHFTVIWIVALFIPAGWPVTCQLRTSAVTHTNTNHQLSMQKYWACHDVIVFNICICPQRRAQRLIKETLFYKGHILSQQLCLTLYESEQHCKIDSARRNKRAFVLSAFYL